MEASTPRQLDTKAERMLAIYAEQRFLRSQSNQRLRTRMLVWAIRTKVMGSLKRTLDVTVASLLLAASAPLMAATALAIKIESPGPIIFRQVRVGKDGEHFYCYKFRSMYIDAEKRRAELLALNESDGPVFKIKRDPRVTRIGRVIRKLSIDELPQLVNVLKGDMSLVGPRPAIPSEVERYTYDQIARLRAMPGITGLQQVSGRSNLDFKRWIELDLQYIAEQSVWKDLEILLKTIPAVLSSRGAY
ncbi:MAG: sugar transferase [Candidatus Viridilinea halotolerans]|uniref:Sugar transferase n=1 Tax=Candidatus Viridilinea halotolerans TaxID=2491704 RepID=A0A426TR75_9CHLR|nr:MAG: sugar transferase [Candidatus Viridilinea halotolerans]